MKKFYYLLILITGIFINAQTPIITMIADGDCSGGTPKVIEIYANGTVDFTLYSLEKSANGGSWGSAYDLSGFGTVTDDFIYVFSDSTSGDTNFSTEFPNASPSEESGTANNNGDDAIRIVTTATTAVIDQFGEDNTDGSGTAWEYADGYAKRNDGMGPNATFTVSEWTVVNGGLNGQGSCQGGTIFEDVMGGIGTYMATASTDPGIAITDPANGSTLALGTTSYNVTFTVSNFAIPADGHIHAYLDGTDIGVFTTTDPIPLTGLTSGSHTIKLQLRDPNHTPLSPDVFAETTFTIPAVTTVSDLAALRADAVTNGVGGYYEISGPVVVSYVVEDAQTGSGGRNQRYVQDATGGLLLDDVDGVLAEVAGDELTSLMVKTSDYNGVLQGLPQSDPGASSTGNVLAPAVITLADYMANSERYESVLIEFDNVTFTDGGSTFAVNTNYDFGDGTNTLAARTAFDMSDIIGTTIPTDANVTGLGAEFNGTLQLLPRTLGDITNLGVDDVDSIEDSVKLSNTLVSNQFTVFIEGDAKVELYNINGMLLQNISGQDEIVVNTSNLSPGAYLVRITQDNQTVTKKVLKK